MADVRFFTMSDADHFLGLVAMVKSLRFQGHHDRVTVLDLGLAPAQRAALQSTVELVQLPEAVGRHPFFLSAYPVFLRPQGTAVCIDTDVIITQTLDPVFAAAARGMFCAASDVLRDRWFDDWQSIFELRGALRRQTYVNAGFLAFSTAEFPDLFARWWECCDGLVSDHAWPLPRTDPVGLLDQDALNALVMSEVPADRLWLFPRESAVLGKTALERTTVVDRHRLVCRHKGHATVLLHSHGSPKPWQAEARRDLKPTAYLVCLRALLTAPDALSSELRSTAPVWLRPGAVNAAAMQVLFAMSSIRRGKARLRRLGSRVKRRALAAVARTVAVA